MKKQIILSAAVLTVIGVGILSTHSAFAQTTNPQESLIQKLVDTFHLNKTDVQKVFTEQKQQNQTNREAKYKTRLDALVKNGKITAAQETLILNKQKELESQEQANFTSWKNLTPAERKAKFQEQKTALENWAKQNGINIQYLRGPGMRKGFGMGMGMHDNDLR